MDASDTKQHQTNTRAIMVLAAARRACLVSGLLCLLAASAWLSTRALSGLDRLPDDVDGAVAALAAALAAAVLMVWAFGAVLTALALTARAAGRASRSLDALSAALTPVLLRRVLAAGLGVAALGGVAGPALAAPAAPPPARATTQDTAQEPQTLTWPAAPEAVAPPQAVVVRRGDTLWDIASRALPAGSGTRAVATAWPRWYEANRAVIGADPDLLLPGQRLVAPEAGA